MLSRGTRSGWRSSARDVVALVVYAGMLSTVISATVGVTSLWAARLLPDSQIASAWRIWWVGDLGGDIAVAPALLIFASGPTLMRRPWIRSEAIALGVALAAATAVAFTSRVSVAYVVIPMLLWIAVRFGQPGTAVGGLIVSAIAISMTAHGRGPFIGSSDAELLGAQLFVGVATVTGLVASALSTERRRAEDRLRRLAERDPLTGVFNRRRFTEELERWIAYAARYGGQGAVLVIDVDHFKEINDAFGHAVGDQALARVAGLLRERVRRTDAVGRLGGWAGMSSSSCFRARTRSRRRRSRRLEKVRREGTVTGPRQAKSITVSIGIGHFGPAHDLDAESVLRSADLAMYEAKEAGRDRMRPTARPIRSAISRAPLRLPTRASGYLRGSPISQLRIAAPAVMPPGGHAPISKPPGVVEFPQVPVWAVAIGCPIETLAPSATVGTQWP